MEPRIDIFLGITSAFAYKLLHKQQISKLMYGFTFEIR